MWLTPFSEDVNVTEEILMGDGNIITYVEDYSKGGME